MQLRKDGRDSTGVGAPINASANCYLYMRLSGSVREHKRRLSIGLGVNLVGGCPVHFQTQEVTRSRMEPNAVLVDRNKGSTVVYKSLVSSDRKRKQPPTFQFFEKEFTFACHGANAYTVASRFYTTGNVIKQDQGVDTVEVGTKMFATILHALLADHCSVEIWGKGDEFWEIKQFARPGDWSQVEALLTNTHSGFWPSLGAVVISEEAGREPVVCLAVVSVSDCKITLYETIPSSSIARLDSILVRHRIAECIVPTLHAAATAAESALHAAVLATLKRANVVVSDHFFAIERSAGANAKTERARCAAELLSLTESQPSTITGVTLPGTSTTGVELLNGMPLCTLLAAELACRELGLLGSPSALTNGRGVPDGPVGGFQLACGNASEFLEYDSAVVEALHLFPALGGTSATIRSTSDTTGGAQKGGGSLSSLFELLNQCKTAVGSQTLRAWLLRPLRDLTAIRHRQNVVHALVQQPHLLEGLRETRRGLRAFPDISRLGTKLVRSPDAVRLPDLLTLYRAVLRLEPLADTCTGASTGDGEGLTHPLQSLTLSLRTLAGKCAKFLALVEEVVDDDRLVQTYGRGRSVTANEDGGSAEDVDEPDATTWELEGVSIQGDGASSDLFRDRWVRVKPSFNLQLQQLYTELMSLQQRMHAEHRRVCALLDSGIASAVTAAGKQTASASSTGKRARSGASAAKGEERAPARVVMLETTEVHGPHFRVTKTHAARVLKALGQSTAGAGAGKKGGQQGIGTLWGGGGKDGEVDKEGGGAIVLSVQRAGTLFVTPQLKALSQSFSRTRDAYTECQAEIVRKAVEVAATFAPVFREVAETIGALDCLSALAHVALYNDWVQPTFGDISTPGSASTAKQTASGHDSATVVTACPDQACRLRLTGLRHPLLEQALGAGKYIPSDLTLTATQQMCLITGPNMGGKSTFMRAMGLCVVMAQIGSFVPAAHAHLQVHDKLFVRIGAADSVSLGVSTFMAEMLSVAGILQGATQHSLVLVDELGRGTSTDDGFGIAAAILESLLTDCRSTVLCATHFHDLTSFFDTPLPPPEGDTSAPKEAEGNNSQAATSDSMNSLGGKVVNMHASAHVDEAHQHVTMLFAIQPGPALRSYGINVAQAVRFPAEIVTEAKRIEARLLGTGAL